MIILMIIFKLYLEIFSQFQSSADVRYPAELFSFKIYNALLFI